MNDASRIDGRQHPARPGGMALVAGLLLAPLAWMMQTTFAQTIAAWGCFPHERPVRAPAMPWLEQGIVLLAIAALLLGVAGGVIAWRNWKRTGQLASMLKEHGSIDRHAARDAFIARAGALSSGLFVFALVATDLAWLLVAPCGGR
ncbi:hypothetical protein AWB77_01863 [Caballeronia fortuita]|uniref:Uncharacterized protein n=1 Tax=Caballeronia fortuita TaxID=1777138 RepID=A0A158AKU1_9BURK|nr:hypothetical protein [Caballeronia fortuita]SAK58350.1 hypothetical protein AWB77_01863 [Caballeronia fortuita]